MILKILNINIENFKGIKSLNLNLNGSDININGDNAIGKTTIFDAFNWCLFDKDSNDRADFSLTPLDKTGKQIRVSSTVTITFDVDGVEKIFSKVHKIKEKKIRGQVEAEFQGFTNVYSINDVPMKMSDYKAKVSELVTDETFKMLTNVYFFVNQKEDKQRQILFDVLGVPGMDEILNSNEKLSELSKLISDETQIDTMKKEIKGKIKRYNDEKKEIPTRIDELEKTMIEDNSEELQAEIDLAKETLEEIHNHLQAIDEEEKKILNTKALLEKAKYDYKVAKDEANDNSSVKSGLFKQILSYRSKHDDLVEKHRRVQEKNQTDFDNKVKDIDNEILRLSYEKRNLERKSSEAKNKIDNLQHCISLIDEQLEKYEIGISDLKNNLNVVANYPYKPSKDFSTDKVCPTCKKEYTEDERQTVLDNLLAEDKENFETRRSQKINYCDNAISDLQTKRTNISLEKKEDQDEITKLYFSLNDIDSEMKRIDEKVEYQTTQKNNLVLRVDNSYTKEILEVKAILKEKESEYAAPVKVVCFEGEEELLETIERLKTVLNAPTSLSNKPMLYNDKVIAESKIAQCEKAMAHIEGNKNISSRIDELEVRERDLADKIASEERTLNLISEYSLTKCDLLEKKINSKFKYISFKLFKTYLGNDNIDECCEATINGVPYRSANNAAKINAGLEIINVLSDFYNLYCPIFVDNAESVNKFIDVKTQLIRLNVSLDKKIIISEV